MLLNVFFHFEIWRKFYCLRPSISATNYVRLCESAFEWAYRRTSSVFLIAEISMHADILAGLSITIQHYFVLEEHLNVLREREKERERIRRVSRNEVEETHFSFAPLLHTSRWVNNVKNDGSCWLGLGSEQSNPHAVNFTMKMTE